MIRSNILAGAMVACGAGCLALSAVPALGITAEAACALSAAFAGGGLLIWNSTKTPEA